MNPPVRVSTSDRQAWKRCRRQWMFSSRHALNYEPTFDQAPALIFGTCFHRALEAYYRNHPDPQAALQAFTGAAYDLGLDLEHEELGGAMLRNYFTWATDDQFEVVAVEHKMEVPLRVAVDKKLQRPFICDGWMTDSGYGSVGGMWFIRAG